VGQGGNAPQAKLKHTGENMTNILNISTDVINRTDLIAALKATNAYSKVARFNVADLRNYAQKVQVIRADESENNMEQVALNADNVDAELARNPAEEAPATEPDAAALLEQLDATVEEATKPRKSGGYATSKARYTRAPSKKVQGKVDAMLADSPAEVVVTEAMLTEAGLGKGWLRASANHRKWTEGGVYAQAAAGAGYQLVSVDRNEGVTLRKA